MRRLTFSSKQIEHCYYKFTWNGPIYYILYSSKCTSSAITFYVPCCPLTMLVAFSIDLNLHIFTILIIANIISNSRGTPNIHVITISTICPPLATVPSPFELELPCKSLILSIAKSLIFVLWLLFGLKYFLKFGDRVNLLTG